MIDEVAARVPDSLTAYRSGVAAGPGAADARPLAALRDPAVFDATLAAFCGGLFDGARRDPVDRRALVSYWSQFYLAALATPALTALIRLGRPLPLAFDRTSLELDAAGRPARLLVEPGEPGCGRVCVAGPRPGLAGLVEDHLRPFVALCCAQGGPAPRVIWGNAAVILDYVAGELGGGDAPACAEVASCLGRCGAPVCAGTPLAQALCPGAAGSRRRTCCLRSRLPGIPSCGALCPLERCAGT
ncbi:siderophore-iron reductase FhuF [Methylobacterium radiodurans]|uniref:Siderophore-iron reductase FhuF n=1 Tax=Methylobacterium radiodurans TaxID=2202828 RepID=A0A2U8VRL9_9HYPH|nr:siderophore-iron reductase FhuF [Methylobacterium radiodurans]AWN36285.1 siderophore-iron reductase FhuF [Methylobacterium radiodurans]